MAASATGNSPKSIYTMLPTRLLTFAKRLNVDPTEWTWIKIAAKLFWLVTAVLFTFLTVRTSLALIRQYQSEKTTSRLSVMFNKSFSFPTSTICLPIGEGELDVRQKTDSNDTYLSYQEELFDYFNRENMSKSLFLESGWTAENKSLSSALLHVTWYYLSTLEVIETKTGNSAIDFSQYPPVGETREVDEWNATTFLEKETLKMNVSVEELRQKFGIELLSFYSLIVVQFVERTGDLMPGVVYKDVSYVSEMQICYRIFPRPFQSKNEFLVISVDRRGLPNLYEELAKTPIYIDLSNRDNNANNAGKADSVIKGEFEAYYLYSVSIAAVYRALDIVSGERRCSTNATEAACRAQCRVDLIRNLCNCAPTTWPKLGLFESSFNQCTFAQYSTCLHYTGMDDSPCVDSCLSLCERWRYSFAEDVDPFNSNMAAIKIKGGAFDYPVFEEVWAWTLEEFFGAFGGVLGLWLGLDFMIVIQFLISTFVLIIGICVGKQSKEEKDIFETEVQTINTRLKRVA